MKILYLQHIDWNWIKQRPQFMAEELAKNGCIVDVYYMNNNMKKRLVKNQADYLSPTPIPRLPLARFFIIRLINQFLYKCFLQKLLKKNEYDLVYICHPLLYLPCINIPIFYDCMDDVSSFDLSLLIKKQIKKAENELVKKAKYISFTSEYLRNAIIERYALSNDENYFVSNNALDLPKLEVSISKKKGNICNSVSKTTLCYIGTVSSWFDFDLLQQLSSEQYHINIYGPVEINPERIVNKELFTFYGPINHEQIFDVMAQNDILIMPFVVTEVIRSVNPVKLYEYIYSSKPIIAVEYGETKKFDEYVYLYKNSDFNDFSEKIEKIIANNFQSKKIEQENSDFVKQNTWEYRVKDILERIGWK